MAQQPDPSHRRRPLWLSLPVPDRAAPRPADHGRPKGGAGAQGICYNEDGLPAEYRGNLFFCDWGAQTVSRFEIRKAGGTFAVSRRSTLVSKGTSPTSARSRWPSRPMARASGWSTGPITAGCADGRQTGRLYRLAHRRVASRPCRRRGPTGQDPAERIKALDHPALSVRLESQRILDRCGPRGRPPLVDAAECRRARDRAAARALGARRDRRPGSTEGDRRRFW